MRLTRQQLIEKIIYQAAANNFEFPRWWGRHLKAPWPGREKAYEMLARDNTYFALLFSHAFAKSFWKRNTRMAYVVPATSYTQSNAAGEIVTVTRRAHTKRTLKADAWRYHLREMAAAEEPLRYIRKFVIPANQPDAPQGKSAKRSLNL